MFRVIAVGVLAVLVPAHVSVPASAQSLGRMLACSDVARADERLQCYDAAARLALSLGEAPVAGSDQLAAKKSAELDRREAQLAARELALTKTNQNGTCAVVPGAGPGASPLEARERAIATKEADLKACGPYLTSLRTGGQSADSFGTTKPSPQASDWSRQTEDDSVKVERDSDGEVEAIAVGVKEWQTSATGQLILVLDNGQVWRQTDMEHVPLKDGDGVKNTTRISKGLLGSFIMTVNDSARAIKVRRVDGKKPKF